MERCRSGRTGGLEMRLAPSEAVSLHIGDRGFVPPSGCQEASRSRSVPTRAKALGAILGANGRATGQPRGRRDPNGAWHSDFVIRSRRSRRVSRHSKTWRIVWVFGPRSRSSSVFVPARGTEFGSNFGSKVPETFSWPRLGSVGPHLATKPRRERTALTRPARSKTKRASKALAAHPGSCRPQQCSNSRPSAQFRFDRRIGRRKPLPRWQGARA
jgi:hypothetical protein